MKKFSTSALIILLGLLVAAPVFAQLQGVQGLPNNSGLIDWSRGGGVAGAVGWAIQLILFFTGSIAVLFIIIGGFQYITSGANADLAKRGKSTMVNAIIGLIIVLLSYTVASVIMTTLAS